MTTSDPSNAPVPAAAAAPALRIGDRERDDAVERLRAAAGDGQITLDELETRVEAALEARTAGDIRVLLADLPEPAGAKAAAAVAKPVRLAVTHGVVERLGAWLVPQEITADLKHSACAIDLRTPALPRDGVTINVTARHSVIKILVASDAVVDLTAVGRHHAQVKDRGARHVANVSGPPIVFTGALHHSVIKILRPRKGLFRR
ncbi:MAG TPA: DUF1707 domain-containing protein [Actinocrinis sp.]|uniref:DUF1707 SHOCT-like domain-containing protein n=1 Tax=Actinocrinis sp. TaxID=1920516 RepID=UPI002DDDB63D|nr:DUF1707 domain-containing protein [Actinocrinis sp.]HEV2346321.1 DUF1707 domain-containing protein [Actinocrinis sp.]